MSAYYDWVPSVYLPCDEQNSYQISIIYYMFSVPTLSNFIAEKYCLVMVNEKWLRKGRKKLNRIIIEENSKNNNKVTIIMATCEHILKVSKKDSTENNESASSIYITQVLN